MGFGCGVFIFVFLLIHLYVLVCSPVLLVAVRGKVVKGGERMDGRSKRRAVWSAVSQV
jgi:hypothetical protein